MKKIFSISLLAATLIGSSSFATDVSLPKTVEGYTISENIVATGELRPRFEFVNSNDAHNSYAFTNRFVLNANWSAYTDTNVIASFLDVSSIGNNYSTPDNVKAGYPIVNDEDNTELRELYVRKNFKELDTVISVGKQKLSFNNKRHIGTTDWRQNYSVFDSIYLKNNSVENLDFELAYIFKTYSTTPGYSFDNDVFALNGEITFFNSNPEKLKLDIYDFMIKDIHDTYGLSLKGSEPIGDEVKFSYNLEYSFITDPVLGSNDVSNSTPEYYKVSAKVNVKDLTLCSGYTVQEKDYTTPLADLHSFNGSLDLEVVSSNVRTFTFGARYDTGYGVLSSHYYNFEQDNTGLTIGDEIDVSYSFDVAKNLNVLASIAHLSPDEVSSVDKTTKAWLQIYYTF